jgi:hypothetical protein
LAICASTLTSARHRHPTNLPSTGHGHALLPPNASTARAPRRAPTRQDRTSVSATPAGLALARRAPTSTSVMRSTRGTRAMHRPRVPTSRAASRALATRGLPATALCVWTSTSARRLALRCAQILVLTASTHSAASRALARLDTRCQVAGSVSTLTSVPWA